MLSPPTSDLLQRLRQGQCGPAETARLERTAAADFVAELRGAYPLTFQERRVRGKWEVAVARSLRTELAARPIRDSSFFSLLVVPVYLDCVMVSTEGDAVTGVSRFGRLRVRAVGKPSPGLALTSSAGYKLDLTPDGWATKPLPKRTVRLDEAFLKARGWRFHHLAQFIPTP